MMIMKVNEKGKKYKMKNFLVLTMSLTSIMVLMILTGFTCASGAAMTSDHYAIPTSVMSCGGITMSSETFRNTSTLGQASPLTIASSDHFALYPGFWYTLSEEICIWDIADPADGDVDGLDLYQFINPPYNASDIESFGSEFGREDCP